VVVSIMGGIYRRLGPPLQAKAFRLRAICALGGATSGLTQD
jgi:hypothetical protein